MNTKAIEDNTDNSLDNTRAKRIFLYIFKIIFIVALIITLIIGCINTPIGRKKLADIVTSKTGRETHFDGWIYIKLLPLAFHLENFSIANTAGADENKMADIGKLEISFSFLRLLKGQIFISKIELVDSAVNLQKDAKGNANWDFNKNKEEAQGKKETGSMPEIKFIYLQNSTLAYKDDISKTDINLEGHTQGDELVLTGDGIHLNRKFNVNAEIGSFSALRTSKPVPIETSFTLGNTTLNIKGTVQDPAKLKDVNLALEVKGADAAELFPLFGIALLPTPPYDVTGHLTYENGIWHFDDFKGKMGSSDLSGNLSWDKTRERPKLTAKFVSNNLSFKDLGPLIGLSPEKKQTAEQVKKANEQKQSPHAIPDVPLDITRLSAMDADIEFTGNKVISPNLPLDDFYMKVQLDNKLMKLVPIKFGTANGDIVANLTVNARQNPVQNEGDILFKKLSLARLMEGMKKILPNSKSAEGYIGGKMKFKGQGKSLHDMLSSAEGTLGLGMEGGQISNLIIELIGLDVAESLKFLLDGDKAIPIRCVIGNFDINKGLVKTNTFVVDTSDTIIKGKGEVNLSNEKMNIDLNPEPKDSTLISLRSPIEIRGTIKKPDIDINKTIVLARGGAAAGLALLLPPVAALAFIEPSLGKDSNCAGLLNELKKDTGADESNHARKANN